MRNVEILLSGESRNTLPLIPEIISDLVPKLDWHEVRSIKGEAQVGMLLFYLDVKGEEEQLRVKMWKT